MLLLVVEGGARRLLIQMKATSGHTRNTRGSRLLLHLRELRQGVAAAAPDSGKYVGSLLMPTDRSSPIL